MKDATPETRCPTCHMQVQGAENVCFGYDDVIDAEGKVKDVPLLQLDSNGNFCGGGGRMVSKDIIIVETELDKLSLYEAGIFNAVALYHEERYKIIPRNGGNSSGLGARGSSAPPPTQAGRQCCWCTAMMLLCNDPCCFQSFLSLRLEDGEQMWW